MHKIICHMASGHKLHHYRAGVLVPGEPGEVEVTDEQLFELRADCRIRFLDELPEPTPDPEAPSLVDAALAAENTVAADEDTKTDTAAGHEAWSKDKKSSKRNRR